MECSVSCDYEHNGGTAICRVRPPVGVANEEIAIPEPGEGEALVHVKAEKIHLPLAESVETVSDH
jgi:hypothetical protein